MGLSPVTYALSKKYTEESIIGLGALRGKPCTIRSTEKKDGQTTIVFEWTALDTDGVTEIVQETEIKIDDGTPIYVWEPGNSYKYGDLVIYSSCFYRCVADNNDTVFVDEKWQEIGSPDGNYDIVPNYSDLPARFTTADKKIYYCINDYTESSILYRKGFYLWNGSTWTRTQPDVLDRFTELIEYEADGVTIKDITLLFDGKKVITQKTQDYQVVSNYSAIDKTGAKDVVYMVENPEYDTADPTKVVHYSGHYLFDSTTGNVEYIDEKESNDISFDTEYTAVIEY